MICIRDAEPRDLEALCRIRYADRPEVHLKRIRQAQSTEIVYLVAELDGLLLGFVLLLLKAPSDWLDENSPFPRLIDLYVDANQRSRGIGKALIDRAEEIARQNGFAALNLTVASETNPRAFKLYQRLGYVPAQDRPYLKKTAIHTDGRAEAAEVLMLDLRKNL